MNRRSFLSSILKGAAAFTILPSAGRVWKATRAVPNPLYENVPHEISWAHLYRSPHFEHLPSFQDFVKFKMEDQPFRFDLQLEEPKVWPPNMGETKRIIKHAHLRRIDNQRNVRGIILPGTHRSGVFPAHG